MGPSCTATARCTYAYDYDSETGSASNRRVLVRFDDAAGTPDGSTVDEDGCLWIANFIGGEIRRYSPQGSLDRRVSMPVATPTSVIFGGPRLDILFVTSHGEGHVPEGMNLPKPSPLAGRVFAIHDLGAWVRTGQWPGSGRCRGGLGHDVGSGSVAAGGRGW
jgi:sugar lactone lactonase YvrE